VAARLVAEPGTGEYGVLAVLIRHAADITRRLSLPPGAFRPAPKVRSTVVGLRFHPPAPAVADERVFRAFVQAVFSRRRKTVSNALLGYSDTTPISAAAALHELAIDGGRRPETLTIAELGRLADVFASKSG
jgi:16S rRNA (adenine1518-N6/adenine1519-N6)-dimethyltransferase